MTALEICFWLLAGCVFYPYVGYPLLLWSLRQLRSKPTCVVEASPRSFSLILAVHDEATNIERRLRELTGLSAASGLLGEIIVVSDGSTDETARLARKFSGRGVQIVELPVQRGKAVALSRGAEEASHDILVFADVRQTWDEQTLQALVGAFSDPTIGAVSGELVLESQPGVMAGVGLYWRYEKWLRKQESRFHSMIGVTGAVSAVRRNLFQAIPQGTLLDDVYWPLQVAMQGYRVIHEERARAYDRLPDRPRDEFRRKVRTLCGNFQLVALVPEALLPWRNPIWFQLVSHKLARLVAPWALLGLLVMSALLPGVLYRVMFSTQVVAYLLAFEGLWQGKRSRLPGAGAAASFLVLNSAAWVAFWVWIRGHARDSWHKVSYAAAAHAEAPVVPFELQHGPNDQLQIR